MRIYDKRRKKNVNVSGRIAKIMVNRGFAEYLEPQVEVVEKKKRGRPAKQTYTTKDMVAKED